MDKTEFLEKLKEICDSYDQKHGSYQESEYESERVYKYVKEFWEEVQE